MYDLPSENQIATTIGNLEHRGINVLLVNDRTEALEKILELIPKNSEIMNGGSTTLEQIGYIDFLKKQKDYKNLHKKILNETDMQKQMELRRNATISEYFLGSVNAIAETGEIVSCDATGSRVGAYLYSTKNLVLIAGVNKIVPDLNSAIKKIREYVFPLEDKRALAAYGIHSGTNKWIIIEKEVIPNRITLILVKEHLGF